MIDFHTHILPGIDDGSHDVRMTRELLELEQRHGVDRIVFTPHFYAQRENIEHFLKKREKAYEAVRENLGDDADIFGFKMGAEIYYFPSIGRADMLEKLKIENTNYILLEMPFAQWTKGIYLDILDILEKQEINIILAHVERFYQFQKDKTIWNQVLELPLIPQINTGSLLQWRSRRFDIKFIKEGHKVILGTDCHNTTSRVPNMTEGRAVLEKKLGHNILEQIDQRGERLWNNEEI